MPSLAKPSHLAALLSRLQALRPDDQRRWGAMTPHQAVCHIIDTNEITLGRRLVGEPKQGFMSSRLGQWLVIDSPMPWPKGKIKVPPAFLSTQPGNWDHDVASACEGLRAIAAKTADWPVSLVFGALSQRQWQKLAWRHTNHHLCQFGR